METHKKPLGLLLSSLAALCSFFVYAQVATSFFDEVLALKDELKAWETAHAADFSDVLDQLDDIVGPVFRDVKEGDWFFPYVSSLAEWQIVSGYKDAAGKATGEYRAGNNVTIAEALKMAMEAADIDEDECEGKILHPEARNHWSQDYVTCAELIGMRLFQASYLAKLDRPARRAEVLTMVHDAFGDKVGNAGTAFKDARGHRFESDIAYASLLGIVSGDTTSAGESAGTFRPDDNINRAEVAKIIYQKVKDEVRRETL